MNRKPAIGLGASLLAALFGGWFFLDRKVERLEAALGRGLDRVEKLDGMVREATIRVDEGHRRMEEAHTRRESALRTIDEAETVVSAAAQERSQAESLTEEALAREREAREQAAEAKRREEGERRRREEEWARLERALGTIASARRDEWTLTVGLDSNLPNDKEKISRLAGILLAHHGYRATVEGEGAEAVAAYLRESGIPDDILTRGAGDGRLRLTLRDQILRGNE